MEAVAASASHEDRDQESDDLWSDLLALKKLYSFLRRTEAEDIVPHGEIKGRLDEKSRNLLKKLLDGATQESLQHHQANTTVTSEEQQHQPTTTQQEPKLLLVIRDEDEGRPKELDFPGKKQQVQGECHQLHTTCGVDRPPPPPPPKQWLAISRTSSSGTAAPEPQTELNRCPSSDLKRLNSGGSTRNLILQDQNKTKLQDPSSTHGQSHRRRHPIHRDHRENNKERSRRRVHKDQSVKQSRQSHDDQLAEETPRSNTVTKSTQQRRKAEPAADRSDPRPDGTSVISCRLDCNLAQLKLVGDSLAADARFKNDDLVRVTEKEPPRNEAVELTLTVSPKRGVEQGMAFDRTRKMFQVSTRTDEPEQVQRRRSKRSNQSSSIMRRKRPSHSGTSESNHHHRHPGHRPSIRQVEKDKRMRKNGKDEFEGSHRRRKQPPRASSQKAWSRSSMYSGSRATQSSSDSINKSSQLSSRSHSLLREKSRRVARERSKSGRTASHSRKPSMGLVAHANKRPSNHSLSRHHRRSEVPPGKPLKEQKGEQEGKLGRLKNKLSIIFHHHHNHHHHLHRSSEDKGVVVSAEHRHRSLWEYLLGSTQHCTSRTEKIRKAPQHHQHGHLHAVLEGLIQHMFAFVKRKRRPNLQPNSRVKLGRQLGARTVHWWQRLRRRPRFGHVARKPRLRLGTGRGIK